MRRVIISDTSCFILLTNIDELEILHKLYGKVITTPDIVEEYEGTLPKWVEVVSVKDLRKQQLLELQIDKGGSSAIALALEIENSTLILDDFKARKIAEHLSLNYTGTFGVIIKAKNEGIVASVKPLLEKKQTNFRISAEVEFQVLKQANELS